MIYFSNVWYFKKIFILLTKIIVIYVEFFKFVSNDLALDRCFQDFA